MSSVLVGRPAQVAAAIVLTWLLCPALAHANALFVDDFESGDSSAWSEEPAGQEPGVIKFVTASENGVPGHYTVSLFASPVASDTPELLVESVGGRLGYVYEHAIKGFRAELTPSQAERLSADPRVRRVTQARYLVDPISDVLPHCYFGDSTNTRTFPDLPAGGIPEQQTLDCDDPVPPNGDCRDNWGLSRIDQIGATYDDYFNYLQTSGSVTVYVVDTGVAAQNREFLDTSSNSRVLNGADADCGFCGDGDTACNGVTTVGNGHGTHVAAIIAGRTFGLARDVTIWPVKALCPFDGNYTTDEILMAVEIILGVHAQNAPTAVVNISGMNGELCYADVGNDDCDDIREAIIELASRNNLLIVQSSGNKPPTSVIDACDRSFGDESRYSDVVVPPATISDHDAIARILVVGGSDHIDGRFKLLSSEDGGPIESTIGSCVDIFAPAARIVSAFYPVGGSNATTAVCQLTGTSMAAPHVSGVAAMILANSPYLSPDELKTMILNWGDRDALETNPGAPNYIGAGSPNLLLHWDPSNIFRDGFETNSFVAWSSVSP